MKITSLSIYNFRSIQKLENINLSNQLDIFIGQNDAGKSTILHAMELLFSDKKNPCYSSNSTDKSDLSFHSIKHNIPNDFVVEDDEIAVMAVFKLDDEDMKQSDSTLLSFEINKEITLIRKCSNSLRFQENKKNFGYFALTKVYTEPKFNSLDKLTEQDLIKLMDEYPDSKDIATNSNSVGKLKKAERINALREYAEQHSEQKVSFTEYKIPSKAPDVLMPEFTLLESQTNLDGKNKIIDDAFKMVEEKIARKHRDKTVEVKKEVEGYYTRITSSIFDFSKKRYMRDLESFSVTPQVTFSFQRDLMVKRIGQKESSHFDLQGDGTKRRLMVSILQCANIVKEIEKEIQDETSSPQDNSANAEYKKLKIWAFDEPELHLHPGAQRDLFNSLSTFKNEGFQIICASHSTVFIDNSNIQSIHLLDLDLSKNTIIVEKNEADISELIKEKIGVRNSDIFFANYFLIVEGDTESIALPIIFQGLYKKTLDSLGVQIIHSKGCSSSIDKLKLIEKVFKDFKCLLDKDAQKKEFKQYEDAKKITYLGKCDFEDSFSDEVWLIVLAKYYTFDKLQWSIEILQQLRKEIVLSDKNKKMFQLVEHYYKEQYRLLNNGDTNYPKYFNKTEIGRHLAEASLLQSAIPQEIVDVFEEINGAK